MIDAVDVMHARVHERMNYGVGHTVIGIRRHTPDVLVRDVIDRRYRNPGLQDPGPGQVHQNLK